MLLFVMANLRLEHFKGHLPEAAATPGVIRARYAHAVPDRETSEWRHIAIFDIDRDPEEVAAALFGRGVTGSLAFDDRSLRMVAASAITPRRLAEGKPGNTANPLLFVVLTNPSDGREAEYNDWYDRRHLPDVLAIRGFVAAQRFRIDALAPAQKLPWRYLAIYEVAADAVEAAFAELDVRKGTRRMPISDALDNERFRALYAVTR